MSIIKEALQYLVGLSRPEILTTHGKSYTATTLAKLPSPEPAVNPLVLHSLDGLIAYVKGFDNHEGERAAPDIVQISGPREVSLMGSLYGEWEQRNTFVSAAPFIGRDFAFGRYMSVESFVVELQTHFVQNKHIADILRLVGNLQSGTVKTLVDDGVSQEVTVRKGITKVTNEVVDSPVELQPFRTFQEVEQPSSQYVLRMNRNDEEELPEVALFEVDNKLWELEAVRNIKKYLDKNLKDVLVLA